jgi:alkylation response protein AidB-like acyl-CoA dehydrogenase
MSASPESEAAVHAAGPALRRPLVDGVAHIVATELAPLVRRIDAGHYPEDVLRGLGAAGAFSAHTGDSPDLFAAISAMARVSEKCLATGFCMWCQDTLVWYLRHTENEELRSRFLADAASGRVLGGTGLSNPMKAAAGIEPLRLRGQPVADGFIVNGTLPWVSNLGPSHPFGTAFEVAGEDRQVMAIVDCSLPGIRLGEGARFLALDGTRTCSVMFRDVLVPRSLVLADPAAPFIARVKAGFILLQTGMGLGVIRGCIDVMRSADDVCGEVNEFLDDRPDLFEDALSGLSAEVRLLARTPHETGRDYQRAVLQVRLAVSEWALRAAEAAMLHAGAKGYLTGAAAQRKLREAYFVAIVTPSVKHLRKELSLLPAVDGT